MTAAEVEQLAREYPPTRPAALRMNYGVQRAGNSAPQCAQSPCSPRSTGAWKYRGGGAVSATSGGFEWNKERAECAGRTCSCPRPSAARRNS